MPGWIRPGAVALIAVAGVSVGLAFGAQRLLGSPASDDRSVRRLEAEIEKVNSELSALRRRGSQVIYVERPDPSGAAVVATGLEQTPRTDVMAPRRAGEKPTPELVRKTMTNFAVAVDRRIAQEGSDAEWTPSALAGIRTAFAEHAGGSRLLEAKCGATLCRAVVTHDSLEAQRTLGESLATLPPFDGETHYHRGIPAENPPTTTLYVVRQGYDVKDVAQEARQP